MTEPHKRFSLKYIITASDITTTGESGGKTNDSAASLTDEASVMWKNFFNDGENVETSFFSPKTTRYVYREYAPTFNSRRTYRPETLQRWVVSRMAVGVSSPHSTIRSRLSCPPFHTVFFVVEKKIVFTYLPWSSRTTSFPTFTILTDCRPSFFIKTSVSYAYRVMSPLFLKGSLCTFFRPYSIAVARDTHFL